MEETNWSAYRSSEAYRNATKRRIANQVADLAPIKAPKVGRNRTLETSLADIEHACRVAAKDFGRSKAEIAQALRKFGCTWADGKITACTGDRAALMIVLTTR